MLQAKQTVRLTRVESLAPIHRPGPHCTLPAGSAALASLTDEMLTRIGQITVEFHDDPRFQFGLHEEVAATIARLKRLGFTYLQFNRPRTTNALFIGPALGLSSATRAWIKARFDVFRAMRYLPLRFRQA